MGKQAYEDFDKMDTEPGLGCPSKGCKWAGYTVDERATHIKSNHPGEYQGPSPDMLAVMERTGMSTKVRPDLFHDRRGD